MVIREPDQTTYQYSTHYGGNISITNYEGENTGNSMGLNRVGKIFIPFNLNADFSSKIKIHLKDKINQIRKTKNAAPLTYDVKLDEASETTLTTWLIEAAKQHQLEIKPDFDSIVVSGQNIITDDFSFTHYPFACGKNAMIANVMRVDLPNKTAFIKYLTKNYVDVIESIFSALKSNSGEMQNMLNEGYTSIGQSIQFYEATKNDFYFNDLGKKISLSDKSKKYYFIGFAQTYSVNE